MMSIHWKYLCKCLIAFGIVFSSFCTLAGTFTVRSEQELLDRKHRLMAANFLSSATFGPTPADIQSLSSRIAVLGPHGAFSEWIDQQFSKTPTFHEPLALQMIADDGFHPLSKWIGHHRYVDHAWWHIALTADDQLRQRIAWALSQIFVINRDGAGFNAQWIDASGQPQYLGITDYYDMLVENAFGNYRTLIQDVSLHPIMGTFLSHVKNPKGDPSIQRFPDENYARELMQLFSIGLFEMNRDGTFKKDSKGRLVETYDNDTITNMARVFTGLSYARGTHFLHAKFNFHEPMIMFDDWHDMEEKKLLLGQTLPAGQTGMQDVQDALDNLFNHPNVPPFIARLLIQRLVMSNPSTRYIDRVAAAFEDNGHGVRGDLKAVIKAVLLDREAMTKQGYAKLYNQPALLVAQKGTDYSRLREPVLRYTAFYRALNATSTYHTGRFMIHQLTDLLNQAPYRAPSVFNFYRADYQPPGDIKTYEPSALIPNGALHAPEFQIMNSVSENNMSNLFYKNVNDKAATFRLVKNGFVGEINSEITFDFATEERLAGDPTALLEHLDLLLCHGGLSDESKNIIADRVYQDSSDNEVRAQIAILTVLTATDCAVE
jgi:uncharacterized protein (DUF1800 family)